MMSNARMQGTIELPDVEGVKAAAKLLGNVHPNTIREWAQHRGLPHLRRGSGSRARFYFYSAQILRWYDSQLCRSVNMN